ncbi:hypothetical protein D3C80_1932750 [compost metagenome]
MRSFTERLTSTWSQCSSRVAPMPIAAPLTAAISGFSRPMTMRIRRNTGLSMSLGGLSRKSRRSLPALKQCAPPVMRIAST